MSRTAVGLVSVGYEGRTASELLHLLDDLGVGVLVDVRLTPISRKPGLSKTRLRLSAAEAGIEYRHLPALGNPRDNRDSFRGGNVSDGCIRYSKLLSLPSALSAMDQLEAFARDRLTAVLCFERDHARCHRQVIVDALTMRLGALAPVTYA